jgi:hypothetical protein
MLEQNYPQIVQITQILDCFRKPYLRNLSNLWIT